MNKLDAKLKMGILNKTNNADIEHNAGKLDESKNNTNANLNIERLDKANKTINTEHNANKLGRVNKTIETEYYTCETYNTLDIDRANIIEKEAKIYKFNLF